MKKTLMVVGLFLSLQFISTQSSADENFIDYYAILGISKDANQNQIKNAYSKQISIHYPRQGADINSSETQNSIAILEAYRILKNPETRQKYDALHFDNTKTITKDFKWGINHLVRIAEDLYRDEHERKEMLGLKSNSWKRLILFISQIALKKQICSYSDVIDFLKYNYQRFSNKENSADILWFIENLPSEELKKDVIGELVWTIRPKTREHLHFVMLNGDAEIQRTIIENFKEVIESYPPGNESRIYFDNILIETQNLRNSKSGGVSSCNTIYN